MSDPIVPTTPPLRKVNTRLWVTVATAFFGYLAINLPMLDVKSEEILLWIKVTSIFSGAIAAAGVAVISFFDKLFPIAPVVE